MIVWAVLALLAAESVVEACHRRVGSREGDGVDVDADVSRHARAWDANDGVGLVSRELEQ